MSFFQELKRRNVFRVGIACVLLQGVDIALDPICAAQKQMMISSVTDTALWQPATLWERAKPAISNRSGK